MPEKPLLERAFELARSGDVENITDLRRILNTEGYVDVTGHLSGRTIKGQLVKLMRDSRNALHIDPTGALTRATPATG